MKKLLIVLGCIVAVVVFALRSCQAETGEPSEIIPSATNQVTLTITESNSTQATYIVTNHSTDEVTYGYGAVLEKFQDGVWHSMVYKKEVAYPGVAMIVQPGQQREETTNWRDYHGTLDSGRYRLMKAVSCGSYNYLLCAEFELN